MKTHRVLVSALLPLAFCGILNAQPDFEKPSKEGEKRFHHENSREFGIPGLTDDQKSKLKELKLSHYKEVQPLKNELIELKAKEHTLATAEKVDLKAIDANIDEITKLQNQLKKAHAANTQKIRALLTDEQRMYFDTRKAKHHHDFGEIDHENDGKFKRFWNKEKENGDMPKSEPEHK